MKKKPLLWIAGLSALVLVAGLMAAASGAFRPVEAETADKQAAATESAAITIDVEAALADRALGDPNAPVKMEEFASLTCGHCADFSKKTFDLIRETYIDTGKVYFIYHDFPLNAPALEAAAVARCLPQERYFPFIKFLFDAQDKWASAEYKTALRQNARLVGMNDDHFTACLDNEKLKTGLVEKMQESGKKHDISATPTFVFNDGEEKLSGSLPFESFQKVIEPMLKQKAGKE